MIEKDDLAKLVEDVREWVNTVIDDDRLSENEKIFLVKLLRELEAALLGFHISGFIRVEAAAASLVGSFIGLQPEHQRAQAEKGVSFWQKILGFAKGVESIASATEAGTKAIGAVTDLLS